MIFIGVWARRVVSEVKTFFFGCFLSLGHGGCWGKTVKRVEPWYVAAHCFFSLNSRIEENR